MFDSINNLYSNYVAKLRHSNNSHHNEIMNILYKSIIIDIHCIFENKIKEILTTKYNHLVRINYSLVYENKKQLAILLNKQIFSKESMKDQAILNRLILNNSNGFFLDLKNIYNLKESFRNIKYDEALGFKSLFFDNPDDKDKYVELIEKFKSDIEEISRERNIMAHTAYYNSSDVKGFKEIQKHINFIKDFSKKADRLIKTINNK